MQIRAPWKKDRELGHRTRREHVEKSIKEGENESVGSRKVKRNVSPEEEK
jgi:hypothetical protein